VYLTAKEAAAVYKMKQYLPSELPSDLSNAISKYVDYSDQLSEFITEPNPSNDHRHLNRSRPYDLITGRSILSRSILSNFHDFPEPLKDPNGLQIPLSVNMMPFIFGDYGTIPENLKRYIPLIDVCVFNCPTEYKKVCYLTIDESFVKKEKSQRRPGLHVETIGVDIRSGYGTYYHFPPWWGGAYGGIFLGSNMDNSTAIYGSYVKDIEAIGPMGCIEHMRNTLDKQKLKYPKIVLEKGQLAWITDRTPHESLKIKEDGFRQFFRIVTSNVSIWYSKHSTPSPFGITPPISTKIIDIDKFEFLSLYKLNN